ncbi:hypothetical protein M885DRAFT_526099 [Pelagophyceae sp. CCMP2097]|nr:hypothetical protein M885DRAFT_526099 [Pelagophyceae sp. CCMP2097]|mmetsp:Transcript_26840/g.92327  ORF Transcript_26840/g.92327 Transcript_26840/m.92327 type:complete len:291 (-) Transcript_26840:31-903(-)
MEALLAEAKPFERDDLKVAVAWIQQAKDLAASGASQDMLDQACPFNKGSGPWWWYLLIMCKCKDLTSASLHGNGGVLMPGMTARQQATFDGLCCASCADSNKLKRCGGCGLVSYCGRTCQRADFASHKALCETVQSTRRTQPPPPAARSGDCRIQLKSDVEGREITVLAVHTTDGFGCPSLILYETDAADSATALPDAPYAIVTVPIFDDDFRFSLGMREACLNPTFATPERRSELDALLAHGVISLVPGRSYSRPLHPDAPLPIVSVNVPQRGAQGLNLLVSHQENTAE